MSSNTSKWLTGCGIGCAAAVALIVILGTVAYVSIKSRLQSFEEAKTATSELEGKYGKIQDFIPNSDGTIQPERIRAFLAIRANMAMARRKLEESLGGISEDVHRAKAGEKSFWSVMGFIGRGFGVVPEIGGFYAARAKSMLDAHMGSGEYTYTYVLAYYIFLRKPPEDGPEFRLEGREQGSVVVRDTRGVRGDRREMIVDSIRDVFLPILHNCMASLKGRKLTRAQESWRKILEAEVAALEKKQDRMPFQDGLPEAVEASLRPFRAELEASYSSIVNPLELGHWSIANEDRSRDR